MNRTLKQEKRKDAKLYSPIFSGEEPCKNAFWRVEMLTSTSTAGKKYYNFLPSHVICQKGFHLTSLVLIVAVKMF